MTCDPLVTPDSAFQLSWATVPNALSSEHLLPPSHAHLTLTPAESEYFHGQAVSSPSLSPEPS